MVAFESRRNAAVQYSKMTQGSVRVRLPYSQRAHRRRHLRRHVDVFVSRSPASNMVTVTARHGATQRGSARSWRLNDAARKS